MKWRIGSYERVHNSRVTPEEACGMSVNEQQLKASRKGGQKLDWVEQKGHAKGAVCMDQNKTDRLTPCHPPPRQPHTHPGRQADR